MAVIIELENLAGLRLGIKPVNETTYSPIQVTPDSFRKVASQDYAWNEVEPVVVDPSDRLRKSEVPQDGGSKSTYSVTIGEGEKLQIFQRSILGGRKITIGEEYGILVVEDDNDRLLWVDSELRTTKKTPVTQINRHLKNNTIRTYSRPTDYSKQRAAEANKNKVCDGIRPLSKNVADRPQETPLIFI